MEELLGDLNVNPPWNEDLIRRIDTECQRTTPTREVPRRQRWRDEQLMALRKHFASRGRAGP